MAKVQQLLGLRERSASPQDGMVVALYRDGKKEGHLIIKESDKGFECQVCLPTGSPVLSVQDDKIVVKVSIANGRWLGDVHINNGVIVHFGREEPEVKVVAKRNGKGQQRAARTAREIGD